jgi:hypothetical protein
MSPHVKRFQGHRADGLALREGRRARSASEPATLRTAQEIDMADLGPARSRPMHIARWQPTSRRGRNGVLVLGILDSLAVRVPHEVDPVPRIKAPFDLPTADEYAAPPAAVPARDERGDRLPPIYCLLLARDQSGEERLRPVTLRREHAGLERPALDAFTHDLLQVERFQLRDVLEIVLPGGEVVDLGQFLRELLGFDRARPGFGWAGTGRLTRTQGAGRLYRKKCRAALVLLAAAARHREVIQPRSVAAIMRYLRADAEELYLRDELPLPPEPADFDMLENRMPLLRPMQEDVNWALDLLAEWEEFRLVRLGAALGALTGTHSVDFVGELRDRMAGDNSV